MTLEQKEKGVYLDANILINCFFDGEYLQLLKTLKEGYNLTFLVTDFVIYEVLSIMMRHKVGEYLIKEKSVPLTEIIHKWRFPHSLYEKVEDEVILKIGKENINVLFNKIFKELEVMMLTGFEKEDWKNMLEKLFPQFSYYGIHMEDAIHLTIAIYFNVDYFLTTDSEIVANRKILKKKYRIVILEGSKDKVKKYIEKRSQEL